MSLASSTMMPLGTIAPDFSLENVVTNETISLDDFKDKKALLVMFICRHCPYVKHFEKEIAKISKDYKDSDLGIVGISSNDANYYPEDAPSSLKEMATKLGFAFPYLYDETQDVAKLYTAVCTPDLFLFDKELKLVYRGQIDDSRPGNQNPVTGRDIRLAIDAVLLDQEVGPDQKPSTGCSIKWKKGNEPLYYGVH